MQRSALIPSRTFLNKRSRAPAYTSHLVTVRLRRIMLAKSWNYAFKDSRIMLVKSSYYALAPGDIYSLCCTYGASKFGKLCFFRTCKLQVAISTTKYRSIPISRCPCMLEINMEKRKHYFFYSSLDFFCTSVKILFHCQNSVSYMYL